MVVALPARRSWIDMTSPCLRLSKKLCSADQKIARLRQSLANVPVMTWPFLQAISNPWNERECSISHRRFTGMRPDACMVN